MKPWSLRLRSFLLLAFLLLVFVPLTIFTLDRAFSNSLVAAKQEKLSLMALSLISAFSLQQDQPTMPDVLYQEQLNFPQSGYLAAIMYRDKIVWQSASSLGVSIQGLPFNTSADEAFVSDHLATFSPYKRYFLLRRSAEFAAENGFEPVQFFVLNEVDSIEAERAAFRSTAWRWLALLTLLLLLTTAVGTGRLLAPVRQLMREIDAIAEHRQPRVQGQYPQEFTALKRTLNELVAAEQLQRERYKHSLDDLAHSLKTPLAVLHNDPHITSAQRQIVEQIQHLIVRQLKRAAASPTLLQQRIAIQPGLEKLLSALNKVYCDKALLVNCEYQDDGIFRGDETDLLEILGNILDNAYKAARQQITIRMATTAQGTEIVVDDDGPGIAVAQRAVILQRGARLDTYHEGYGLGMAIVQDLLAAYGGSLRLEDNLAGGLRVVILLPA